MYIELILSTREVISIQFAVLLNIYFDIPVLKVVKVSQYFNHVYVFLFCYQLELRDLKLNTRCIHVAIGNHRFFFLFNVLFFPLMIFFRMDRWEFWIMLD